MERDCNYTSLYLLVDALKPQHITENQWEKMLDAAFPLAKPDPVPTSHTEGDWIYVYKTGISITGFIDRDTAKWVIEEQARVIEELRGKPDAKPEPDDDEAVHRLAMAGRGAAFTPNQLGVLEQAHKIMVAADRELRGKPSTPSPASQQDDTPGVLTDEELWAAYRSVEGTDHIISALRAVAKAQRERDRVRVSINEIRECLGGVYNDGLLHLLRERGVEVEDSK